MNFDNMDIDPPGSTQLSSLGMSLQGKALEFDIHIAPGLISQRTDVSMATLEQNTDKFYECVAQPNIDRETTECLVGF